MQAVRAGEGGFCEQVVAEVGASAPAVVVRGDRRVAVFLRCGAVEQESSDDRGASRIAAKILAVEGEQRLFRRRQDTVLEPDADRLRVAAAVADTQCRV